MPIPLQAPLSDDEAGRLIKLADPDGSGLITRDEFQALPCWGVGKLPDGSEALAYAPVSPLEEETAREVKGARPLLSAPQREEGEQPSASVPASPPTAGSPSQPALVPSPRATKTDERTF